MKNTSVVLSLTNLSHVVCCKPGEVKCSTQRERPPALPPSRMFAGEHLKATHALRLGGSVHNTILTTAAVCPLSITFAARCLDLSVINTSVPIDRSRIAHAPHFRHILRLSPRAICAPLRHRFTRSAIITKLLIKLART
ncbi:hypothetical protein Q7P37_003900 [Cladosporium fusiforme]